MSAALWFWTHQPPPLQPERADSFAAQSHKTHGEKPDWVTAELIWPQQQINGKLQSNDSERKGTVTDGKCVAFALSHRKRLDSEEAADVQRSTFISRNTGMLPFISLIANWRTWSDLQCLWPSFPRHKLPSSSSSQLVWTQLNATLFCCPGQSMGHEI